MVFDDAFVVCAVPCYNVQYCTYIDTSYQSRVRTIYNVTISLAGTMHPSYPSASDYLAEQTANVL